MYLYVPKLHFMTFYPYSDLNQNMVKLGAPLCFLFCFVKVIHAENTLVTLQYIGSCCTVATVQYFD